MADLDARAWSRVFRGELCVCHVETALGLPQPMISRHLAVLRAAGVVDSRRDGTWVYYRLSAQPDPQVQRVIESVTSTFAAQRTLRADLARTKRSCGPGACS
jgi:ArsR family transcriptional regulator